MLPFYIYREREKREIYIWLLLFQLWPEFRPGEKSEKHFPLWHNSQTVCSGLTKFLPGSVWLGEVCRDFTVFTETSAQCAANGALRSDSLKIKNFEIDDQFQPVTVELESITVSPPLPPQAQYRHCISGRVIHRSVSLIEA